MANNFQDIEKQGVSAVEKIELSIKELNKQLEITNNKVKSIFTTVSTPGALSKQVDELKTKLNDLNSVYEKQQKEINNLNNARRNQSQRTSEEIVNQRALAKASDLEAKSKSNVVGAYQRLNAQRLKAQKTLRDLIASEKASNVEINKAQKEYDRLTAKVNKANKATSNFSKTGLGSTVRGFKNLLGAFGAVSGTMIFANLVQSGFNLTRQLDSLNFTMKAVMETEELVGRSQEFLKRIADDYGASLVTLTERYNKFYTAARQSGVTLEDTELIYDKFTKTAGILGLKSHELEGVFLALEQMLSKGKVTTEELRRQLGERLPGAFGVMAQTVNKLNPEIEVTIEVLDDMLKKGQVLSKDVLPEFARQYEKSIGADKVEKVENLNASIERMTNSWVLFIQELTTGDSVGSKALKSLTDGVGFLIEGMRLAASSAKTLRGELSGSIESNTYKRQLEYYKSLGKEGKELAKIDIERYENEANGLKRSIKDLEAYNDRIQANKSALTEFAETAMEVSSGGFLGGDNKIDENNKKLDEQSTKLARINAILKAAKEVTGEKNDEDDESIDKGRTLSDVLSDLKLANEELNDSTKEQAPAILDRIEKLNKEKEAWERRNSSVEKAKKINIESIGLTRTTNNAFEDLEKTLKDLIDLYGLNTVMGQKLNKELQKLYKTTESLEEINKEARKGMEKDLDARQKSIDKKIEEAEATKELAERNKDLLNSFFEGFKSDFFSDLGFDFIGEMFFSGEIDEKTGEFVSNFQRLSEAAQENGTEWAVWGNTVMEVAQEVFGFLQQQQDAYYEARFDNLRRDRDESIRLAGESASAREEIDRQYDAKKRKLQREQAKANKETAIFNTIINTAQAVVSMLAQAPWPSNIVFAALAAAMGAAQVAMISSQSIPNYWSGREDGNGEWAMVDELRPEVHTDKHGNIKSMGSELGANKRWLEKGDKIYSSRQKYFNSQLDDILSSNGIAMSNSTNTGQIMIIENKGLDNELFKKEISSLRNTINNKENVNISVNKSGVDVVKGGKRLLNNKLKLKARQV